MNEEKYIRLAHGGGGQLTGELTERVILPALGGTQIPGKLTDAAILPQRNTDTLAFTTDSYVVRPLLFPGGDIGKLAVCGTINDLAVSGARPKFLSLSLVLEEGLEIALLRTVLESAGRAAKDAGIDIATGDTKVVERGAADRMIVNTTGIGLLLDACDLGFHRIAEGDRIVLSGPLGEHALAVMSKRESLSFTAELESDCAAINDLTEALLDRLGPDLHFMRDPTRGGLAATLVDIATATGCNIEIRQEAIPINSTARAAAEMLGLDLLSAANEGKLVAVLAAPAAPRAVEALKAFDIARDAAEIGQVGPRSEDPLVEMVTSVGGRRIIQMPYGEDLPRIC